MPTNTPRRQRSDARILWTPDSGITYSALSLFLECREQFRLSYVEGWSPKAFSDAIEFGSAFHYFAEHMNFDRLPETGAKSWEKDLQEQVSFLNTQYRSHLRRNLTKTIDDKFSSLIDTAAVTFRCYCRQQPYSHIKWLSREEEFNQPIFVPNPGVGFDHPTKPILRTICLRGKRDGVFQYTGLRKADTEGIRIFETKTKSQIDEQGLLSSLAFDLQAFIYAYATQLQLGQPVRSILYNVIRRPQSRQKAGESETAFLSRLEATINADPKHYFYRQEITLSPGELDLWAQHTLHPMLNQVLDWWESLTTVPSTPSKPQSPLHFLNPNALYNRYGRCHLFDLITTGKTFGYKRRTSVFPELSAKAA